MNTSINTSSHRFNPDETFEAEHIGAIKKNDTTTIRVRTSTAQPRLIDVREFVESETYQGPTRKGIMLTRDEWRNIGAALSAADYQTGKYTGTGPAYEGADEAVQLIHTEPLDSENRIEVRTVEYKGTVYADVRLYVESSAYQGPTRVGIRLRSELVSELAAILQEVEA